jgi:hypothetical protein
VVVMVLIFGILVAGVEIVGMGLKFIINLSKSMKSFGLSGIKENGLFSWLKVKSSKKDGVVLWGNAMLLAVVVVVVSIGGGGGSSKMVVGVVNVVALQLRTIEKRSQSSLSIEEETNWYLDMSNK